MILLLPKQKANMHITHRFEARIRRTINRLTLLAAALTLCSLTPSLAASADPQVTDGRTEVDLSRQDWIQEGKTRFIQTCAYCHGQEGEAGKTRPFRTHTDWNPQEIFDTITNGRVRGGNVMPTWKATIPPAEIWKIVAYIKSLSAPNTTAGSE